MPMLSRSATAHGERFGQPRRDESLLLKSRERGIHSADRDGVAGATLDLLADGYAIGIVVEAQKGKHDEELELAETWTHLRREAGRTTGTQCSPKLKK